MIRMIPTSTQIQMGTFMRACYPASLNSNSTLVRTINYRRPARLSLVTVLTAS
jgi:hypothetical protein